jgi:hypothetical protein
VLEDKNDPIKIFILLYLNNKGKAEIVKEYHYKCYFNLILATNLQKALSFYMNNHQIVQLIAMTWYSFILIQNFI